MSLQRAVAAPFRDRGTQTLPESEFVVVLSLDRGWFSPDQAKRLINIATGDGLLERDGDNITPGFEIGKVTIPDDFSPDESILQQRSSFERVLETLIEAGIEKQTAVAETNRLQVQLGLTLEAAAVVYAMRQDIDIRNLATSVRANQ